MDDTITQIQSELDSLKTRLAELERIHVETPPLPPPGHWVKHRRVAVGMSVEEFAVLSNLTRGDVYRIETGDRPLNEVDWELVVKVLTQ